MALVENLIPNDYDIPIARQTFIKVTAVACPALSNAPPG